jgi:hypothetical protein
VLRCVDQPAQDSVRIDFKDTRHGADAEAFGQSRNGPHQRVGIDLLAVQRGAVRLEEIPVAAQTHQLSPAASIGMTVGADITEADPAVIRTGGMRAEMARGVNLAVTPSGQRHTGWWCAGDVRLRPDLLLTHLTVRLATEAYKRLGLTLASREFRPCWRALAALSKPIA